MWAHLPSAVWCQPQPGGTVESTPKGGGWDAQPLSRSRSPDWAAGSYRGRTAPHGPSDTARRPRFRDGICDDHAACDGHARQDDLMDPTQRHGT